MRNIGLPTKYSASKKTCLKRKAVARCAGSSMYATPDRDPAPRQKSLKKRKARG